MKKGFTLIELLAVIVILAIISLIAVPIVINIINDSKKSSQEESMELYIKQVESAVVKENLQEKFNPSICLIQEDSSLICDSNESNKIDITIKGDKPTKGSILFENGKIIKYKNIKLNDLYYHMDIEGNQTITTEEIPAICKKEGQISTELGTKYDCDVNDEKTYTFYVLSKEGYNVNLIMNANICYNGDIQEIGSGSCKKKWYSSNDNSYGPVTAMNAVYDATKSWDNIPNPQFEYYDEGYKTNKTNGYQKIISENGIAHIIKADGTESITIGTKEQPLKSRLPRYTEVTAVGANCKMYISPLEHNNNSCERWLGDNLSSGGPIGYWLMDSDPSTNSQVVFVDNNRRIGYGASASSGSIGIRPVITITMDELGIKQ